MKRLEIRHFLIALLGMLFICSAISNADPIPPEPRKIARQSSPTNASGNQLPHINSLSSSQDVKGKPLPSQQPSHQNQQANTRPLADSSQEYSSAQAENAIAQPKSTIYSHIQSSSSLGTSNQPGSPSGGYMLSVNTRSSPPTTLSQATPTILMQYLPQQQHQAANGVQYLQFIPTRPLIVPISPYLSPQYESSASATGQPTVQSGRALQQYGQVGGQNYANAQNYVTAGQSYVNPSYGSTVPPSGQYPTYATAANVGSYASPTTSVISFFRPHTGIQLISGPVDMSLNTNEYIPIQGESAFKIRRA